jgi:hypothetical protein
MYKVFFIWACLMLCGGCKAQGNDAFASAEPMPVCRFDKALFILIETGDTTLRGALLRDYPEMMNVLGKGVLNMQSPELPGFFDRLLNYYSEPALKELYRNAIAQYDSVPDIERALGRGFAYLKANFPAMPAPKVYMHVSGLNQNILAADNLLSVSIDKYMGKDYPLYLDFFYDYQREKMQRANIAPDCLTGWLMSEYPFAGKENVLLERMVYEGKMKYLVSQALPDVSPCDLMGYTAADYEWCGKNEALIWKTLVGRKHLYTPDHITTNKYFEDTPAAFLVAGAPGNLGAWIGWQIVRKYMEATAATPESLMQQTDAQEILAKSRYKP